MTTEEFRNHPAYKYYMKTLLYNNLYSDLCTIFDYVYIECKCNNNEYTLVINNPNIIDEVEEQIDRYLSFEGYKDLYYIKRDNIFYFYIKE